MNEKTFEEQFPSLKGEAIAEGKKRLFKRNRDYCKCGHKKDHHLAMADGSLKCEDYIFNPEANKMIQCGCKIE
jgi:hypothetical protein